MSELALAGRPRSFVPTAARHSPSTAPFTVDVLPGRAGFEILAQEWRELSQRSRAATLFQSPDLLSVWARHYTAERNLLVVAVRQNGRAVMIWPLSLKRLGPLRTMVGAGHPVGQYDEILLEEGVDGAAATAAAILSLVTTVRVDTLSLERVRQDGPLHAALRGVAPSPDAEAAPFSDLSSGFEALRATLKSRVNSQQRKRVRRFEAEGVVTFDVAAGPDEAEAWLAEALTIKREWLRSTGRISRAFAKPHTGRCLQELGRNLTGADEGLRTVVFRLALDGRTAAVEMCFRQRDTLHLYLGAFAPEFAAFGPGNILTEKILRWCEENGIARYDMLPPRSRFKSEWQSGEVQVHDYAIAFTASGALYNTLVLQRLRPGCRALFYRLPPRLRTAIASSILKI